MAEPPDISTSDSALPPVTPSRAASGNPDISLSEIVAEVFAESGIDPARLEQGDREYLEQHALKKPMGVAHIWALGVGSVITGAYFGWNPGLGVGGPIGMLLASLFVCALYMMWVLALSELSVAMPFAGGPMAYGRRAAGTGLGFLMGWSMFLECLFATIGTAIAAGGYVYFIINLLVEGVPKEAATTAAGLVVVVLFAAVQWVGVKQQAKVMEWMTYGAIAGLLWFWIACIPAVRIERILTQPLLTNGWTGVLQAIPFAIWWLVMIEGVALAAEEAHEPQHSIPRGLMLAQVTLIVLVIGTWFFASAAGNDYRATGDVSNLFPLPFVYREVWPERSHLPHLLAFTVVALCGMFASFNGMFYATTRQAFSLGRAGYLPRILGRVHCDRRTPDVSIAICAAIICGFVVWGMFDEKMVGYAVLTCNLTALIWYVLAMVCLFVLRRSEPGMARPYRVPWYPVLPVLVTLMALFSAAVYGWLSERIVLWMTLIANGIGIAYYAGYARTRIASAAPEELAARGKIELESRL